MGRSFFVLAIAAVIALPLSAQFAITVQQNGQASNLANGSSITLNAPAVGQTATATITLTYLGTGTISFSNARVLGSTSFTTTATTAALIPLQATTFSVAYAARDSPLANGQFLWPFSETGPTGTALDNGAVSFNLIGTAPNIVVSQVSGTGSVKPIANGGTIQFPDTLISSPSKLVVAISNTGSGPAIINSIAVSGDAYQLQGLPLLPLNVIAGNQLNLTAQFQPVSAGTANGSLFISFASGTYSASIAGKGVNSFLSYLVTQNNQTVAVSPNQTIALAKTNVGSKSSAVIQFQNIGTTPIVLSTVGINGLGFSITDGPFLPLTLQPQQTDKITITYSPTQPGPTAGRLVIGSDDFLLSADTGVNSFLSYQVTQNNKTVAVSPNQTIALAKTNVGSKSSAVIQFQNIGTTPIVLSTVGINGSGFSITDGPFLPITLQPQQTDTITITYSPTQPGPTTGRLVIGSDDFLLSADTGVNSFLSYQVTQNNKTVAVSPNQTIVLADTNVGSKSSAVIQFQNIGTTPIVLSTVGISGSGFSITDGPFLPITLQPQQTDRITITYSPTQPGPTAGRLVIGSDDFLLSADTGVNSFLSYQVTQNNKTVAVSPNQTIVLADTNVGSKSSAVIQFQNLGTTPIVLSTVGISGSGFSITDGPFLPLTLQPQQADTITITYSPTQPGSAAGRLVIGSDDFLLSARPLGALLQYSYQSGASTITALPGDTISFPPLAVGQTGSIQFSIANAGTSAASLVSIGVVDTKGVFQLTNLPGLPSQLNPGSSVSFGITLSPQAVGSSTTTLVINNQPFLLSGFSSAPPPVPSWHFTGASGVQQPFQQPTIGLSLDSTYPIALTGTLTLSIASTNFSADPAIQFSSGGRQAAFTIPANTLNAVFTGGATQIRLQTGTVAGAILITPAFTLGSINGTDITPLNPASLQLTVPALAPTLLTASIGTRTTASLSVVVTGFSTTRNLRQMTVQFKPSTGFSINTTSVTLDISAAASVWYLSGASQNLGGQFNIEIPFNFGTPPVGTDLTKSISGIAVTATNDVGASNALQLAVP